MASSWPPGDAGRWSVTVRLSDAPDAQVLACADAPAGWDRDSAVEVELVPGPRPIVTGGARFAMAPHEATETALVTWSSVSGLGGREGRTWCSTLGAGDELAGERAALGLHHAREREGPDGLPIRLAWTDDRAITSRVVGDEPVRQLAVHATSFEWPHRWPGVGSFSGGGRDGSCGVTRIDASSVPEWRVGADRPPPQ